MVVPKLPACRILEPVLAMPKLVRLVCQEAPALAPLNPLVPACKQPRIQAL